MKGLITIATAVSALALPFAAFAETTTHTVTIDAYVDGQPATTVNASGNTFPMQATWVTKNIGSGTGSYGLGPVGFNSSNPYEAVTSEMSFNANYDTHAVISGNGSGDTVVGKTCEYGKPFELVGYTTGSSLAEAASSTPTNSYPSFNHIQNNKVAIVWLHHCITAPPVITSPKNGYATTTAGMTEVDWTPVTSPWGTVSYIYQSATTSATNADDSYTNPAYTSGPLSGTSIPTPGTPPGTYYIHVKAIDSTGHSSWWSNAIKVKVTANPSAS